MSHDLDVSTGKPAMAYVGEKPWHGLGEEVAANEERSAVCQPLKCLSQDVKQPVCGAELVQNVF